jgi:hypothetical protein
VRPRGLKTLSPPFANRGRDMRGEKESTKFEIRPPFSFVANQRVIVTK